MKWFIRFAACLVLFAGFTSTGGAVIPKAYALLGLFGDDESVDKNDRNILSNALYTDQDIAAWVKVVAPNTMTISYKTLKDDVKTMASYFTDSGWAAYKSALKKSGLIETAHSHKQHVSASVIGEVEVISSEEVDGVYRWVVSVPFYVRYKSSSWRDYESYMTVKMILVRYNPLNKKSVSKHLKAATKGVGIEKWIGVPRRK